jgi:hypothetical protein
VRRQRARGTGSVEPRAIQVFWNDSPS